MMIMSVGPDSDSAHAPERMMSMMHHDTIQELLTWLMILQSTDMTSSSSKAIAERRRNQIQTELNESLSVDFVVLFISWPQVLLKRESLIDGQ